MHVRRGRVRGGGAGSRGSRARRGVAAVALAVAVGGVALAPPAPAALGGATAPATTSAAGVTLVGEVRLSDRLTELTLDSTALARRTRVRILTPAGFDPATDHLPVLWLLHGGFGSERDWTDAGAAEALTAGLPMVVVMPAAGTGGWYSDWLGPSAEGPQRWETYHLDELRPFVEARYATRTDRDGRAVAGLSMGGFGAMHHAARHPDLFGFAAAFSGAVDSLHPGIAGVIMASPLAHQALPGAIFGDPVLDLPRWRANNPVDLAADLRSVEVQLRTGDGTQPPGGDRGDPIQETGVRQANDTLSRRLTELGIAHTYVVHPGVHAWSYWRDDLAATLPAIVAHFAAAPGDPTRSG
jgi:S-formylglutathione hydrolase FrmB